MTFKSEGVWAVVDRDYREAITMVYETEIEALRAVNDRGYGNARFVPWGKSLTDITREEA